MRRGRAQIESLVRNDLVSSRRLDRFLTENEWPLVGESGVTFGYRGTADAVLLQHWICGLPTSQPFRRLRESDFWFLELELPSESRIEYKINVVRNGENNWILDPLNPRQARDPFGANSVCYGPGYVRPTWTIRDPEARRGSLETMLLKSQALDRKCEIEVYVPARFRRRRRYPLLVVHDGTDYLRFAQLGDVLDNLIHRLEIPPMVVAFTSPGDRLREYGANPAHAKFICRELVPRMEQEFPLIDSPDGRGVLGASFGAVAALHAAWSFPGAFSRVLIQSGSFAFSEIGPHGRGKIFDSVVDFMNDFRSHPGQPADKVFMSCGVYEPLIYENRSLLPLLQKTGLKIRYVEARDGHNWENWRDRLRDGLSWSFRGPLWMIYE